MLQKDTKTLSLRQTIRQLPLGKSIAFPITRFTTIRVTCQSVSMQYNLKFKTKTDKVAKTISVLRIR